MSEAMQLQKYMRAHIDEYLEILREAVLIETPTEGDKGDLARCREYFAKVFSSIGFSTTLVSSNDERYGDHVMMEYGEGADQLLIGGHYDTVFPKGTFLPGLWQIDGEKLIGPGVLDMKGGNVLAFMAVKALQELDLMPSGKKIVVFLNSDEEAGSYSSHMHYKALAKKSKAAFIVESSVGVKGDSIGGIKSGRFGRGNYTFAAQGKPAHSGLDPRLAESALKELAQQAIVLEGMADYDKVVTIGCTCLKSGNAGWPTIPGDGELTIDARFSTMELMKEYDGIFRNIKPCNPNVKINVTGGIEKPPFDPDLPGNKALQQLAIQVGLELGVEITPGIVRGGSDGNFTASAGCPTLDGLGVTGGNVHQPGEYMRTDHIPFRGALLAKMILEVLKQ